jgi:hypothetical protein
MAQPSCWEIKKCGRQPGGAKATELGVCAAAKEGLGHSCWGIAGTLCGGKVQGSVAQKSGNCMECEVYRRYNRVGGTEAAELRRSCPEEMARYEALLRGRLTR